jgi:hypothetical protein
MEKPELTNALKPVMTAQIQKNPLCSLLYAIFFDYSLFQVLLVSLSSSVHNFLTVFSQSGYGRDQRRQAACACIGQDSINAPTQ